MMDAISTAQPPLRLTAAACDALNVARSTLFRSMARLKRPLLPSRPRSTPPRALSAVERQTVRDLLNQPRFADQAPAEVYATSRSHFDEMGFSSESVSDSSCGWTGLKAT